MSPLPAPREMVPAEEARFTLYRPTRVEPLEWYPLLVFVQPGEPYHDPRTGNLLDPDQQVAERAGQRLRDVPTTYRSVVGDTRAPVERGDDLVLIPWVEQGEIEPGRAGLRRGSTVDSVEFRLRVHAEPGTRVRGGVQIFRGMLLLAEADFTTQVSSTVVVLGDALDEPVRVSPYRSVFMSYSRHDQLVVQWVLAAAALGDDYLMDVVTLRSGELWEPQLKQLIRSADVFQLFWSYDAMHSPNVRQEWEYALALGRPSFVRPVYWQQPRPTAQGLPPPDLTALHWAYIELREPPAVPPPASGGRHTASGAPPDTDATPRSVGSADASLPTSYGPPPAAPAEGAHGRRSSGRVWVAIVAAAVLLAVIAYFLVVHAS